MTNPGAVSDDLPRDKHDVGPVTGLPLDLPPGQHPLDWYISTLSNVLGFEKAAAYLGIHEQ